MLLSCINVSLSFFSLPFSLKAVKECPQGTISKFIHSFIQHLLHSTWDRITAQEMPIRLIKSLNKISIERPFLSVMTLVQHMMAMVQSGSNFTHKKPVGIEYA